jgi:alkanesulfonate monooxygenase SsuD/methylene tetrahydromethanopterin reductase-like flavin-dependent oxidoreductase (luciferase family)
MDFYYFSERPVRTLDENLILDNGAYFGVSNAHFDAVEGAQLHNEYLDECCFAEQVGFDGVALNEHHANPFCMGSVVNIEAAVLARITDRVKIMLIGNPLPIAKNPLRIAEELAMIDMISHGRLVSGWVRGGGPEQFANNANPAYNREYFEEAHDFIMQAWTRPGPWRYEGKHYHYRYVNPWALPYQKPTPLGVAPGILSLETATWAAEHRYPYMGLGTSLLPTSQLWDAYADRAAELGYQAGPENFGYVIPTVVADTREKADELGRSFVFGGGQNSFAAPAFAAPPGYNSEAALQRLASAYKEGGTLNGVHIDKLMGDGTKPASELGRDAVQAKMTAAYERGKSRMALIVGTPEEVVKRARIIMEVLRPGILSFFGPLSSVSPEDRLRNIELLGNVVVPELREYAKELDLPGPFEAKPGDRKLRAGEARAQIVDRVPLARIDSLAVAR